MNMKKAKMYLTKARSLGNPNAGNPLSGVNEMSPSSGFIF
jgi:hypothetical protein